MAWARAGTNGKRRYTPKPQARRQAAVVAAWERLDGREPYGPDDLLNLTIDAVFAMPRKWVRADGSHKPGAPGYRMGTPDWDNVGKLIGDALQGHAFADDRQIVRGSVVMRYATPGEAEGCWITLGHIRKAWEPYAPS